MSSPPLINPSRCPVTPRPHADETARRLKRAKEIDSVASLVSFRQVLPVLVAVTGLVGTETPLTLDGGVSAVLHQTKTSEEFQRRNAVGTWIK